MGPRVGWILDVYIEGREASIWIRTVEGEVVRVRDHYSPSLYILPRSLDEGQRLLGLLAEHPHVTGASWVEKYIGLSGERRQLLHVLVDGAPAYRRLVRGLEGVAELYNTDLLHVQQYLFTGLRIEPTSKVEFSVEGDGRLAEARRLDDEGEVAPPPFKTLYFNINARGASLTPDPRRDPIASIEVRLDEEEPVLIEGREEDVLVGFEAVVRERDPDILVAPHCDHFTLPYLLTRARLLNLPLQLGRAGVDPRGLRRPLPSWWRGRVVIDHEYYGLSQDEWGLAGLVERSRFGFLPPGIAGRWTANRINDSRVCYELMQRGHVIPRNTGYYEYIRPMEELVARDRGGMIIAPRIGVVHANVGELDYESQFPHILVREGISYETVKPEGVERRGDAILPLIAERALRRRLYFKRLRDSFPRGSREWRWCEQRQNALKLILVCIYGTSGCCWNRFGNVLAFEEINRRSREIMIRTKEYVQARGYELIYADVDSYFLKKEGATREEYERLAQELSEAMKIPISLKHHYKFLLLLPLESDPTGNMEAQKRYFGVLYDGELVARGIELRRHDTPPFIRDFQARLIQTLLDCASVEEVHTRGYGRALRLLTEAIDQIMGGGVPADQLIVSKTLRKPVQRYRSVFPHVAAAIQLASRGKAIKPGNPIQFLYRDAEHHNPLCRVIPWELAGPTTSLDREKYRDMLLDAAETVLSTFGFRREALGLPRRPRNWSDEVREEMRRVRELEARAEELDIRP